MANLKKDDNYVSVSGGVTDDALLTVQPLRVNATTNYLLTETTLDSEASGSVAVNVVAGNITVSTGTPVSLDWIAGTKLSGGSVAVNLGNSGTVALRYDSTGSISVNVLAMPAVSVSTGTPVSLDWIAGTKLSGGSVAVNVIGGTFLQAGGTILAINAGGTVNAQKYGDWNIDSVGSLSGGSIQLMDGYHPIGSIAGGTISASISGGSVGLNYTSGGSITVNVREQSAGTVNVQGFVAHDSASTAYPLKVGAKAETALSGITAVADGDTTDLYAGADGVLFVRPHTGLEDIVSGSYGTVGNGTSLLIAAQGAGVKTYLTDITIGNSYGTMMTIGLYDGSQETGLKYTIPAPATGGATHGFTVPLAGSANSAWYYRASLTSAASGSVIVSAVGFKSKI